MNMRKILFDTLLLRKGTPAYQKTIGLLIWIQLISWFLSIILWITYIVSYFFV